MSDRLWRDVTAYWAQDPTARPLTQAVVEDMVWPPPPERNYSTSPPLAPVQNPTHLRHNPIPFQQLRAFWESVKEPSRTLPQPRSLVWPPPKQNHSPPSPLSPTKDPSSVHIAHPQPQQQLTPSTYQSQQPSPAILTLAEHKERLLIAIRPLIEVQQLSRPDAVATLMKRLYDYGVADVDVETRLEILTKIRDSASSCYFRAWADNRTAADIMWRWLKQAFTVSHAEQGDQKEGTLLSETIMPLVQIIDRLPMTVESLKKSKLRKIVARLVKNPPSSEIKSTASNVERRWCAMVSEQCLESEKGADGT
ncbi:hypothetical protein C8R43DRAFT_583503 [Mycena crocata]|nr:hypothetical protein C8R43DRAFT_583503 [Mycena crocata]